MAGVQDKTVLEITGGTVESTKSSAVDGAAAIGNYNLGNVRVLDGVVRVTAENGTAIYNSGSGSALIFGGTVENTAVGMAIYNSSWSSVEISGGMVHAENGNAIYNEGKDVLISGGTVSTTVGTAISAVYVIVENGTAIIQGGDMAIDPAPELELSIKVTASTNYDGSLPVTVYNPDDIATYRYLKFEEDKDTTVTDLDLTNKLTATATGGTPQAIIMDNAQYNGTVTWNGNPTKFLGSTLYTAIVTLTAKDGYTFFGVAQDAFSYTGATSVANDPGTGKTLTVTVVFPGTAAKELQSIAITKAPNKVNYKLGETFSTAGMVVKATYNDGTENTDFIDYAVDKTDALTMDDTAITLTANGTSITTTQTIFVDKPTALSRQWLPSLLTD